MISRTTYRWAVLFFTTLCVGAMLAVPPVDAGLRDTIANVRDTMSCTTKAVFNPLRVFKWGMKNFERLNLKEYNRRADQSMKEALGECLEASENILSRGFGVEKIAAKARNVAASAKGAADRVAKWFGKDSTTPNDPRMALAVDDGERNFYEEETGVLGSQPLPATTDKADPWGQDSVWSQEEWDASEPTDDESAYPEDDPFEDAAEAEEANAEADYTAALAELEAQEAERQRQAELARQEAEAEARRQAELEREEARRQAELEREEARRQAELEREEARRQAELEREEARRQAELERAEAEELRRDELAREESERLWNETVERNLQNFQQTLETIRRLEKGEVETPERKALTCGRSCEEKYQRRFQN